MSSQQLAAILQISAQFPPPLGGPPAQLRAWFEAINAETPLPVGASYERVDAGPCGGDLISFPSSRQNRLLIYFHGGGFVFGSSRSHRVIGANLSRTSGLRVLTVDYRLAPEHPTPAAHEDALAIYRWALAQGYTPVLCGDSAGGNLALSTAIRARDLGLPAPAALVLMSPALDFSGLSASARNKTDAPLLTRELVALFTGAYFQGATPDRLLEGDLTGLPPTLIHVGDWEILLDDSVALASKLPGAELKIWPGMCHSWQIFAPMLDEGMASIEEAGAFAQAWA